MTFTCAEPRDTIKGNNTRQGYARKRTLKPAGYFLGIVRDLPQPFNKPATTYAQQVAQLQLRGMAIQDPAEAAFYLQHLNYYRLAAYWLPFETDHANHVFAAGTDFRDVLNL